MEGLLSTGLSIFFLNTFVNHSEYLCKVSLAKLSRSEPSEPLKDGAQAINNNAAKTPTDHPSMGDGSTLYPAKHYDASTPENTILEEETWEAISADTNSDPKHTIVTDDWYDANNWHVKTTTWTDTIMPQEEREPTNIPATRSSIRQRNSKERHQTPTNSPP